MRRATVAMAAGAVLAGAAALAAGAVLAQDFTRNPSFGTHNLAAGFTPDPYVVNVTAGGSIAAERIGGAGCVGSIAQAPDVRVNYTAGQFPLRFMASSRADVTIVVNDPQGRWHCNDDYRGHGTDGAVLFQRPLSGQYDIWIGSYDRGSGQRAQLLITEVP